jgi:hypothetical protein
MFMNLDHFWPAWRGQRNAGRTLPAKYRIKQLSTGDMLRAEVASDSDLGRNGSNRSWIPANWYRTKSLSN